MNTTQTILQCKNLSKSFDRGDGDHIPVLKNIQLHLKAEDALVITGPSGSGKSTLLHLIGGLDLPSSGEIIFQNRLIHELSEEERTQLRSKEIAFVFQSHMLLPQLTLLENVLLPTLAQSSTSNHQEQALELLNLLGLSERVHHFPSQLSGGECQRGAMARALILKPQLLLADEPTGNLDQHHSQNLIDQLKNLQDHFKMSMIIVTHSEQLAQQFNRRHQMIDGQLQDS